MSAGQPGLEPRSLVLETNILPIKLLTYTCTIPVFERRQCHQNSVFSPLCHEQWEKARVEACGVEPHQVLRLQRSALPVELNLHNHIKKHIAESRVFETHAELHTQFSRLVPSLKDLLSI